MSLLRLLNLPPVAIGPFSPSGEHVVLTNGPFHLDIVASEQEIVDYVELKLSITDGYGNFSDVIVGLGIMGTVKIRIVSPLNPNERDRNYGPDMDVKLFNAELP